MPIITRSTWTRELAEWYPAGCQYTTRYTDTKTSEFTITTPPTQKRSRPKDLFAAGTGRDVRIVRWSRVANTHRVASGSPGCLGSKIYVNSGYEIPSHVPAASAFDFRTLMSTRTLLAIKDQKVNLSVSIAELPKTISMFSELASETVDFLRKLRKARLFGELAHHFRRGTLVTGGSRELSRQWLRYSFGITPLLSDVYGSSELIRQRISLGQFIRGTCRRHLDLDYPWRANHQSMGQRCDVTLRLKASYRYKVSSVGLRTAAQSGFTNPLSLVWELVPYSFLVDYFYNIGDFLSSLDSMVGVTDLRVIYGGRLDVKCRSAWSSSPTLTVGKVLVDYHLTELRRLPPSTATPLAPQWDPHLSVRRMTNILALLGQSYSQKR